MPVKWGGRTFATAEERDKYIYRNRAKLIREASAGRIFGQCILWLIVAIIVSLLLGSVLLFVLVLIAGVLASIAVAAVRKNEILEHAARHVEKLAEKKRSRLKELQAAKIERREL